MVAMLFYWWIGFFRPQDRIWWDVSNWRIPLMAAALFVIPAFIRGYYPQIRGPIGFLIATWFLLACLAHFTTGCGNFGPLGNSTFFMFKMLLVVFLTVRVIEEPKHLFYLAAVLAIPFCFYSGKSGLAAILAGGADNYGVSNFTGAFTGSNAYAMGTGMLSILVLFCFQQTRKESSHDMFPKFLQGAFALKLTSVFLLLFAFLSFYYIMSLQSRGSSLATLIGLVIFAYLNNIKITKFLLLIPVLVGVLMVVPLPQGYEERIQSVFAEEEELDDSAASRPYFWDIAMQMVGDRPLGVGPGCYSYFFNDYDITGGKYGTSRAVHSSHFQILSETGYMGLVCWGLLFFFSYIALFKMRSYLVTMQERIKHGYVLLTMSNALISVQTIFLLGGSFYALAFTDIIWLVWGMVMAMSKLVFNEKSLINREDNQQDVLART